MNELKIIEKLLIHRFVEESQIRHLPGFKNFRENNRLFREYSPIAEGYVYCQAEDLQKALGKIANSLLEKIHETWECSHLPMRTVEFCLKFIEKEGFSRAFAENQISTMKFEKILYSFPSIYGELEEEWLTPLEDFAALMKELFSIDQEEYRFFLEQVEINSPDLGSGLIESENPAIKEFLTFWSEKGIIRFREDKDALFIKEGN